jgi:hypothetical protein
MRKLRSILFFLIAAGITLSAIPGKEIIKITVRDKVSGKAVSHAKVELRGIIDNRDIVEYVEYTDKLGRCSFAVNEGPSAQFVARATAKGLVGYYDSTYSDLDRSIVYINEKTGNRTELWLTTDTLNHEKFWAARATRININRLVQLLKTNQYPSRSEIPLINWNDIPALLAIGNDTTVITRFPVSLLASTIPEKCRVGIVALWFVESARITVLKGTFNPNERFPSMTPTLVMNGNIEMNPVDAMNQAYLAYKEWWERVKGMKKEEGCNMSPLENTNLEWR